MPQQTYFSSLSRARLTAIAVFVWFMGGFIVQIFEGPATLFRMFLIVLFTSCCLLQKPEIVSKNYVFFISFLLFLTGTSLCAISFLFGEDPIYSSTRAIVTTVFLFMGYFLVSQVIDCLSSDKSFSNTLTILFILFFSIILAFSFYYPEFRSGYSGLRLSAGVNPNTIGLLTLLSLLWIHVSATITHRWCRYDSVLLLLCIGTILWTVSRSVIAAVLIFYITIMIITVLRFVLTFKFILKFKSFLLIIFGISILMLILFLEREFIFNSAFFQFLYARTHSDVDQNIVSRTTAWNYLLQYWHADPLFGGLGWYNASRELIDQSYGATSPHNFYVRVLAEVGLIGLVITLLVPAIAILRSATLLLSTLTSSNENYKIWAVIIAALCALFSREFVEDSFMVDFFGPSTAFVFFLSAIPIRTLFRR